MSYLLVHLDDHDENGPATVLKTNVTQEQVDAALLGGCPDVFIGHGDRLWLDDCVLVLRPGDRVKKTSVSVWKLPDAKDGVARDGNVDVEPEEPLIAHGAGPAAPRRVRRKDWRK